MVEAAGVEHHVSLRFPPLFQEGLSPLLGRKPAHAVLLYHPIIETFRGAGPPAPPTRVRLPHGDKIVWWRRRESNPRPREL